MAFQPSARWTRAIRSSHVVASKVEHVSTGTLLKPTEGSVTLDITADQRGRCSLTIVEPEFLPVRDSILAPYGNQVRVWRGIDYRDGSEPELAPLGTFRIETASAHDAEISLELFDSSMWVSDDKFEEDGTIPAGTDYIEAILDLIVPRLPFQVVVDFPTVNYQTPTLVYAADEDPWVMARGMAEAIGMDLYFDNEDVLTMRPMAAATDQPSMYLVEGEAGVEVDPPSLLDASEELTRGPNKWIVVGDNPDVDGPAPRGEAVDDDPASRTRYGSMYGRKPETSHSSYIVDDTQAAAAAAGKKQRERGLSSAVAFGALVDPTAQPGVVAGIKRTVEGREAINENHIIDSVTIPLEASTGMTGQTRALRIEP